MTISLDIMKANLAQLLNQKIIEQDFFSKSKNNFSHFARHTYSFFCCRLTTEFSYETPFKIPAHLLPNQQEITTAKNLLSSLTHCQTPTHIIKAAFTIVMDNSQGILLRSILRDFILRSSDTYSSDQQLLAHIAHLRSRPSIANQSLYAMARPSLTTELGIVGKVFQAKAISYGIITPQSTTVSQSTRPPLAY